MDARLPPTLRVNRGDIKELNKRANLIKIINDRKNALKKRQELQKEYDDIMKKLFKSLQKKKKKLARGRGGIRTSRSWEKRQQERYKRGERRAEGEDEPTIIGEEVRQDSQGNMIITYRDYEKEAQARQEADVMREALRIEDRQERELLRLEDRQERQRAIDRLDQIRREDIQLRFDERQRDRDDRLRREEEQFRIARADRDREDLWREMIMRRDDERDELNRIIEGRRLDIAQEQMGQGRQFIDALRDLELRLNQRFDAAEAQYRNLLQTNPGGVELRDLQQQNPQLGQPQAESEFIELRDDVEAMPTLEELLQEEEDILPTEETEEDFEIPQRPQRGIPTPQRPSQERPELPPRTPQARMYTEDLKPQGVDYGVKVGGEKEDRQPRGAGRSFAEDLEIIERIGGLTAPEEGTPERIEWDNQLFSGKLDVSKNLALQEIAEENRIANLMREANNERLEIQELKDREQELQERIIKEGQARDLTLTAEKIREEIIAEEPGDLFFMKNPLNFDEDKFSFSNPMNKLLEQNKQEIIDNLPDGAVVSEDLKKIGFTNPVLPVEQQEEVAEESGLVRVGSQGAKDLGIVKTPREVIQVNPLLEDERFIGFLQDVYNGAVSENPKQVNLKNKNRQFFINKGYANQDEALRDALDVFGIRYRKKDNKTTLMRKLQEEIDDGDYKERLNTRYGGSVQGTAVYRKLGRAIGGFSGSSEEGESSTSGPQGEDVADLPLPYESPQVSSDEEAKELKEKAKQQQEYKDEVATFKTKEELDKMTPDEIEDAFWESKHIPFSETSSEEAIELGPMTEEEIAEQKRKEEEKKKGPSLVVQSLIKQQGGNISEESLEEVSSAGSSSSGEFTDFGAEGRRVEDRKSNLVRRIASYKKTLKQNIDMHGDGNWLDSDRKSIKEMEDELKKIEASGTTGGIYNQPYIEGVSGFTKRVKLPEGVEPPNYIWIKVEKERLKNNIEKFGDGKWLDNDRKSIKEMEDYADKLEKQYPDLRMTYDAWHAGRGDFGTSQPQGEDIAELPRMTTLQAIQELPIDDKGQALGGRIERLQKKLPHEHTLEDLKKNTPLLESEDYKEALNIHHNKLYTQNALLNYAWYLQNHGKGGGQGYSEDELEDLGIDIDDVDEDAAIINIIPDAVKNIHEEITRETDEDVKNKQEEILSELMKKENRIKEFGEYKPITARQASRELIRDYEDYVQLNHASLDYEYTRLEQLKPKHKFRQIDKFETEVEGSEDIPTPKPKFNIDELQKGMRIKVKGEQEGKILHINRDEGKFKGTISFRTPDMPTSRKVLYPSEHHEIEDIGGFGTAQKGPGSMRNIGKHRILGETRPLKLPMGEKFVSPPPLPTLEGMKSEESEEGDKFIPGKYKKGQEVSYYRVEKGKGGWRDGTIGNYEDGGPDGALLSVKIGKRGKEVETTMDKVIAKPTAGELLEQKALREGLKEGILREGESRKGDKKGSFWEDRDKYIIHNNTPHEFRGIQPYGKSLIHYHKDNPEQHAGQKGQKFKEFSYYHTPLDADGGWMEQATGKRIIAPKTLDPALEKGLLRLEKLDKRLPFKEGSKKKKLEKKGRPFGTKEGFVEAPEPEPVVEAPEPSMLAGAGEVVGNIAGGVASAGAGLIGGIAGGVAAQLPTPYEAGVGVGGALAGAGVGLIQGAAGLVAGAIGGVEEEDV